ncbi:DNA-formamidopyrimidine glycosylase family protein [uncultured Chryseobacterium sp.]|uniref:DNA-formamidopyrimidine glycosylase family protein n=1 Tax=uncultured Chryseobacterium sp. TaxID=259322 RepID=UPI002609D894|nr:DNA-formamidopyrimidine glycosylase family protein [uncultured Chryseobacterium sp.]
MPEGPTIIVFAKKFEKFKGNTVTESGGYRNPFAEKISGQKLMDIKTYGKYLILQFKDFFVTVHFGLFGSFLVNDTKKVNPSFSLHFGDDFINFYVVNVKLIDGKSEDFFNDEFDPFSKKFNPKMIEEKLFQKFPKKEIGDVLMNQDLFPGLGNVIRNEVLFLSKIHPESVVEKIPEKKILELIKHIVEFSKSSVELIEKKIWKSSSAVYQKEKFGKEKVEMVVSPKIKRKTFFVESLQQKYS